MRKNYLDKDSYNIKDVFFDFVNKKRINKKYYDSNHYFFTSSRL